MTAGEGAPIDELLDVLTVRPAGSDRFLGGVGGRALPRLFGGQVLAQALLAAGRTVPGGRRPHSLHAYFVRPGDSAVPLELDVRRLRDGRHFSTRRVTIRQNGRDIAESMSSFHDGSQPEPAHQQYTAPGVPAPDEVPPLEHWLEPHHDRLPDWWATPHPFDLRFTEEPTGLTKGRVREPRQHFWLRTAGSVPGDGLLHAALIAYASDLTLLDTALFPSGRSWYDDPVAGASLDHTLWFHAPPRADDWLLCEQSCPVGGDGLALTECRMTDRAGRLVVSGAQEGLIRERPARP
ncbi:acyl-CoA thioesterase [Streptomyces sp. PTD5-9]|uniref:acyl-CoA thioesterase n=1 Tax=Streptomyces sp. PTD5-9 TaxID=3120150 RepID=UPI0030085555